MKNYEKPLLDITSFKNEQTIMLVSGNYYTNNINIKNSEDFKNQLHY